MCRLAQARAAGDGYGAHDDRLPNQDIVMRELVQSGGFDLNEIPKNPTAAQALPSFSLALAPVVMSLW